MAKEVKEILEILGIDVRKVSKGAIKKVVSEYARKQIKKDVEGVEKLEAVSGDSFDKVQDYFSDRNIYRARTSFRIRSSMVPYVKDHFKNSYKNNMQCEDCLFGVNLTFNHAKVCPAWEDLRRGKDLDNLKHIAEYFIDIGKIKEKKE